MAILKESWSLLNKPTNISVKDGPNPMKNAIITMEPFNRGFGNTLGNTLRRVLLSYIAGFAVTSIKIDGVLHEYGTIDGVKEDVSDIIMNIKSLVVVKDSPSPSVIKLSSNKQGLVLAGSIETGSGVEVVNKDLVICTLNEGAKIDMQMVIESGTGYVSADKNKKDDKSIGTIMIDSIFSPIRRVVYSVQNARVGQNTDYDKLVMELDTDGSITPRDAIGVAAKIIQDQLDIFVNFDVNDMIDHEPEISQEMELNKNLFKSIDELELSVRSYNCLRNENINYVGDLSIKTEAQMLKTSNFGRKSLNELKENLKSMGLTFGMKIPSWPPNNIAELSSKVREEDF